jgi:hypothetical protein
MKLTSIITILFLSLFFNSFGQRENAEIEYNKNTIYVTAGTFGILGGANLNYERYILKTNKAILSSLWLRAGGGYWYEWTDYGPQYYISAVGLLGRKNSHLEYGLGITSLYDKVSYDISLKNYNGGYGNGVLPTKWDHTDFYPIFNIGYRYQKPQGHFIFRTGVVIPSAAIYFSLGVVF